MWRREQSASWMMTGVVIVVLVWFGTVTANDVKDEKNRRTAFDSNPVCPIGCVTCSAYNGCVTCQRSHFLFLQWHGMRQTGSCVEQCPYGYFGMRKRGHGKCFKCSLERCENCSNRTTCASCSPPFFLVDGQCVDKCPESHPYAGQSRQCGRQVDCEVGAWGFWGVCNRKGLTCGYKYGLQKRKRKVVQEPSENGLQCPSTVQFRKCRMKHRFCEDTKTNKSDLSKVSGLNDINWKRLERLFIKHRKRKQRTGHKNAKKTKQEQQTKKPKEERTKKTKQERTTKRDKKNRKNNSTTTPF